MGSETRLKGWLNTRPWTDLPSRMASFWSIPQHAERCGQQSISMPNTSTTIQTSVSLIASWSTLPGVSVSIPVASISSACPTVRRFHSSWRLLARMSPLSLLTPAQCLATFSLQRGGSPFCFWLARMIPPLTRCGRMPLNTATTDIQLNSSRFRAWGTNGPRATMTRSGDSYPVVMKDESIMYQVSLSFCTFSAIT